MGVFEDVEGTTAIAFVGGRDELLAALSGRISKVVFDCGKAVRAAFDPLQDFALVGGADIGGGEGEVGMLLFFP